MKSIKVKIGMLVLLCVLAMALVIGSVSIQSSKGVVRKNSFQIMTMLCSNKAETVNAQLSRIEQSVITLSDYAVANIKDVQRFQTDKNFVTQYSRDMEDISINAAKNTEGAMTVYIRFNPEFTEPTSGLFCSRSTTDGVFEKLTPTDFSMYDPSDIAHVGWYYVPIKNNKPTWMAPYINENLNVKMISYVIPIMVDGVSIGIVGMDIDFKVIEDIVNSTSIYEDGYAFLTDENANIILHKNIEMNQSLAQVDGGSLEKLAAELKKEGRKDSLFAYSYQGETQKMTFAALDNGMRLALTAPASDIDSDADALMRKIVMISLAAIIVSLLISWFIIYGIVKPIQELNAAAGKIAGGSLDVTITCKSRDEIGTLAESFRHTVTRLHTYIDYINETSDVLRRIAEGNLRVDLKYEYAGEFARLKEALYAISGTLSHDIEQIKLAASQVSEDANQVAAGAQVLSLGAVEQTATVEELSNVMHEMSGLAKANQSSAQSAKEFAKQAGAELTESNQQMNFMVESMDGIAANADEISNIIKTIDDIAMQTNILALNAAIEAARAGEAGKGFSIVAGEVKDLASKSAEAAKTIAGLVENTVNSIKNGSAIADKTGAIIVGTLTGAKNVLDVVEKIASDSSDQAEAAARVLVSVEKISAVVQQNLETSKEEANSSEELSAQAQMMTELMSKFRTENVEKESFLLELQDR